MKSVLPGSTIGGRRMRERLFVYIILCIATIIRFDFLVHSGFRIDSDEAIVGLMAKHILETGQVPVFYYGQHYMGSFEPLVAALSFSFLGVNEFALKIVPLCFSIIFLFLVYRLASLLCSPAVGKLALLLGAFPPSTLIIWSTKARGGFIEVLCIGTAALIATVYWCQKHNERTAYAILTGLLLGFGWWVNNQIIYYMLPIGFVMLGVCVHAERAALSMTAKTFFLGIAGFLVGGAPFWIYNLNHDFASLQMFRGAGATDILSHAVGFVTAAVPILLGGIRFWHTESVFPGGTLLAWVFLFICLGVVLWHRSLQVRALFRLKIDMQAPIEIILLLLLSASGVFIVSSFGYLSQAPRYLLPAYSSILIIAAFAVAILWKQSRAGSLLLLGSWFFLSGMSGYYAGRAIPGEPFVFEQQRVQGDHTQLIDWLELKGYSWVRTNYWIGYRLSFETNERVRFLIFGEPHQTRIPAYEAAGIEYGRDRMPLVLVPAQAQYVEQALQAQGYRYEQKNLSGYVVYYNIRPGQLNLKPIKEVLPEASDREDYIALAVDGLRTTRWRSARPQTEEMVFTLRLPAPERIRGLRYEMGDWPHDYPRELQIILERADGSRVALYDPEVYLAVRYFLQGDSTLSFYMDYQNVVAVHLKQTATHPVFDWSIAEVSLFR